MVLLTLTPGNWISIVALIPILFAIFGIFFKAGKMLEKIDTVKVNQEDIKTDLKEVKVDVGNVKVDVGKVQAEMGRNDGILKLLNNFLNKREMSA